MRKFPGSFLYAAALVSLRLCALLLLPPLEMLQQAGKPQLRANYSWSMLKQGNWRFVLMYLQNQPFFTKSGTFLALSFSDWRLIQVSVSWMLHLQPQWAAAGGWSHWRRRESFWHSQGRVCGFVVGAWGKCTLPPAVGRLHLLLHPRSRWKSEFGDKLLPFLCAPHMNKCS